MAASFRMPSHARLPLPVRLLGRYAAAGTFIAVLILLVGRSCSPAGTQPTAQSDPEIAAHAMASRNWIPDRKSAPVIWREVDYREGSGSAWSPKGEAPVLHELVNEGRLPPVAERTGPEPVVLEGVEGLGRYGGSWHWLSVSDADIAGVMRTRLSYDNLVRWSPHGYPVVPHLAREWTVSDDMRVYTFTLRRGVRWSDGQPFTAADILYWWEWEAQYFKSRPGFMSVGGELGTVELINDHQVRFVFPKPHGMFLERLASADPPYAPKHYLSRYHPALGDPGFLAENLRAMQLPGSRALYTRMSDPLNPACPRMWPWIYRQQSAVAPHSFVRNPYYFAVDPAGNQLPYLDRVVADVKARALITTAAGDVTMQPRFLDFQDYTQLASQADSGNYRLLHWYNSARTELTFFPNLNAPVEPDKPATKWKHHLLNQRDFREALSLAIDRQTIIDAVYNGLGDPAQAAPGPGSVYHNEKLLRSHTAYDPTRANALLDGLGLTQRDSEGFRTFPDGSRMAFFLTTTDSYPADTPLLVSEYWRAVGVRVYRQIHDRSFFEAKMFGADYEIIAWPSYDGFLALVEPRDYVPVFFSSFFAPVYGRWYLYGGLRDDPRAAESGAIAPPAGSDIRRAMELTDQAVMAATMEERVALFGKALDLTAENVWSISVSTSPPQLVVVKNGFHNVPEHAVESFLLRSPGHTGIETYFWDSPSTTSVTTDSIKEALTTSSSLPRTVASVEDSPESNRTGIGVFIFWILMAGGLIAAGLRHPFVWRRLLLMIPTLAIISVIIFTILQLPPGDFITSKIMQLEMEGSDNARTQMEDLKAAFHFDKSPVKRYLYWSGLMWFVTFQPQDTGLLQGNLGRSMETNQPVSVILGDRLTLTVVISFCTVLFIWLVAVPMGIFSAVRQHSAWDYGLTLIGFMGMSVPPFLLALVLMYFSSKYLGLSASGLFSPEYGAQSHWNFGKVLDLLKRLWIPVIVVGAGSVAAMIRVMRANLLDELKRPYVVTARAKGVRPLSLLFKYPVRMAVNPFVSGIGSLFPHLVSGDSIVAIVLSLPTIAPLLLRALLSLDTYMAASLLMILSLLSVLGTLVSDLLLQWLDPRMHVAGKRP